MKVVKFLFKTILWIVVLVVLALLTLPLWFGPVGKFAANMVVPGKVKTDFHMGHLALNPYTARFELGDTQLGNPPGYSEKFAATVGDIVFDAETLSLASDVIHIEELKVKDIFVSYVSGGENDVNNFEQIQYNVAGGKEKYEAAQAQKTAQPQTEAPKTEETAADEEKPSKKVIIDRLEVSGLVIQLGPIPVRIPSLVLTDIGRKSNGATFAEVCDQIWEAIITAAGALGDQLKALGGLMGDAAGAAADATSKAATQAAKALDGAAGATTKALGNATDATTKALGNATDAAGNATKAVGDGAKKALDALNSLW